MSTERRCLRRLRKIESLGEPFNVFVTSPRKCIKFHAGTGEKYLLDAASPSSSSSATATGVLRKRKLDDFLFASASPVRRAAVLQHQAPRFFLEVFSGDGGITNAVRKEGIRSGPGFDIIRGKEFDLTSSRTQDLVLKWVQERRVWCVWLGTPCSVWCIARKGVRDEKKAEMKDRLGVTFAMFSAKLMEACLAHDVLFVIENPSTSKLWIFEPIARVLSDPRVSKASFHACAYGGAYKKPTTLVGTLPGLHGLVRQCPGRSERHVHELLSGMCTVERHGKKVYINKTILGGAYPPALCTEVARLVAQAADMQRLPKCVDCVQNQEMPLLQELYDVATCAPSTSDEIMIPPHYLEFVSKDWRARLAKWEIPAVALDVIGTWCYSFGEESSSYEIVFKFGQYVYVERCCEAEGTLIRGSQWLEGDIKVANIRLKLTEDGRMLSQIMQPDKNDWMEPILATRKVHVPMQGAFSGCRRRAKPSPRLVASIIN